MCGIWTPHPNWRIFEADAEDICWSCESSLVVDFGPEIAAADGTAGMSGTAWSAARSGEAGPRASSPAGPPLGTIEFSELK